MAFALVSQDQLEQEAFAVVSAELSSLAVAALQLTSSATRGGGSSSSVGRREGQGWVEQWGSSIEAATPAAAHADLQSGSAAGGEAELDV